MIRPTNLKVAFAHLSSRKKQTIIAMFSVMFGVGMFIFMRSFVGGINKLQADLVFSGMAHIRIFNEVNSDVPDLVQPTNNQLINIRNAKALQYTEGIKNATQVVQAIGNNPHFTAITTQINTSATFKNGSVKLGGVLSGVEVEGEQQLFNMRKYIEEGSWEELATSNNHIIIGVGMAKKLNLSLGGNLTVVTAENITKNFKIVGIVFTGSPQVDETKAFIRNSCALQLASKNRSYATDIQVNVKDFEKATAIAEPLKELLAYKVESWQEANEQLVAANTLRNLISTIVPTVLIIVAGFGIYNIMVMTVNEKIKDIAILKALGFSGDDVIQIFLTQAAFIGLLGGILGLILGFTISTIMSKIPFQMAASDHLVILFEAKTYLLAFVIGLIITLIAGYLPAKKAAAVDPVQIIRG
ncbi:MAG: ABC transporter permease [Bacteroidia bacterium]